MDDALLADIIQASSLPDLYLKTHLIKEKESEEKRTVSVDIYKKRSDKLFQQLQINSTMHEFDIVKTSDYNFDGIIDLSVVEAINSGPNTQSQYFLYDPKNNKFIFGFEGSNLTFDHASKRIHDYYEYGGESNRSEYML